VTVADDEEAHCQAQNIYQASNEEGIPEWIEVLCDSGALCNLLKLGNGDPAPSE